MIVKNTVGLLSFFLALSFIFVVGPVRAEDGCRCDTKYSLKYEDVTRSVTDPTVRSSCVDQTGTFGIPLDGSSTGNLILGNLFGEFARNCATTWTAILPIVDIQRITNLQGPLATKLTTIITSDNCSDFNQNLVDIQLYNGPDPADATKQVVILESVSLTCAMGDISASALAGRVSGSDVVVTQSLPAVKLENPLGDITSIPLFVGRVISYILGILGAITLFVFFDGAFDWVTSLGNPQRVERGLHAMFYAVIGLLVIFAAYGILRAVTGVLTGTII